MNGPFVRHAARCVGHPRVGRTDGWSPAEPGNRIGHRIPLTRHLTIATTPDQGKRDRWTVLADMPGTKRAQTAAIDRAHCCTAAPVESLDSMRSRSNAGTSRSSRSQCE